MLTVSQYICVVYMAVDSKPHTANTQWNASTGMQKKLASERQIIIVGDFNGHINEVDGFTDQNKQLMLRISDEMELVVANLEYTM